MTAFTPIMVVILNDVQDEISLDLLTAVHTDLFTTYSRQVLTFSFVACLLLQLK